MRETYDALRRLKAPLPGARPEQLFDALGPQCAAATVGYVAALTPHLVVSSLAGGNGVDATTVSYLLKAALKLKKKEEEEERRKEAEQKEEEREGPCDHPGMEHGVGGSAVACRCLLSVALPFSEWRCHWPVAMPAVTPFAASILRMVYELAAILGGGLACERPCQRDGSALVGLSPRWFREFV